MKINSFFSLAILTTIILGAVSCAQEKDSSKKESEVASNVETSSGDSQPETVGSDIFFCGNINDRPTIMARHHWGNIPVMSFQSEAFTSAGWSPQKRCEEISERLDEFHLKGWLKHLTKEDLPSQDGDEEKTIPVICIAAQDRPHLALPPGDVGLLMTLTKQDDGDRIIAALHDISSNPAQGPVVH